jgi:hypothetical protein
MTVLEFIAAIALLINDLLAVFSILGSALILVMAVVNVALSRKRKVPDQVWMWGWGGFIFGTIGLASLIVTGSEAERIGFLGFSESTIGILLFVSFLLLMGSIMLSLIMRSK